FRRVAPPAVAQNSGAERRNGRNDGGLVALRVGHVVAGRLRPPAGTPPGPRPRLRANAAVRGSGVPSPASSPPTGAPRGRRSAPAARRARRGTRSPPPRSSAPRTPRGAPSGPPAGAGGSA